MCLLMASHIFSYPSFSLFHVFAECLLLPRCPCTFYCKEPEQHLLEAHAATTLALVRSMQDTADITVLVETGGADVKGEV